MKINTALKSPFPYFGGKSAIAPVVWRYLGNPDRYIEPFFGSGAVLLNRPYRGTYEIVNDKDGNICNVWRSIKFSPDETAKWCDWPVNHADLQSRRIELHKKKNSLLEGLLSDPKWHDPELAGYWIWGVSCWIGSGFMKVEQNKRPHLLNKGIHAQIPQLLKSKGVHKGCQKPNIYSWFKALSERLRNVKVVCGDWHRVCGGNWQDMGGDVGIFFDPPYSDKANRSESLYMEDSLIVAHDVRKWCIERGGKTSYRIILAGYFEEHEELLSHGWTAHKWKAQGGYSGQGNKNSKLNCHKEVLFISPHCIHAPNLFTGKTT